VQRILLAVAIETRCWCQPCLAPVAAAAAVKPHPAGAAPCHPKYAPLAGLGRTACHCIGAKSSSMYRAVSNAAAVVFKGCCGKRTPTWQMLTGASQHQQPLATSASPNSLYSIDMLSPCMVSAWNTRQKRRCHAVRLVSKPRPKP